MEYCDRQHNRSKTMRHHILLVTASDSMLLSGVQGYTLCLEDHPPWRVSVLWACGSSATRPAGLK